MKPVRYVVLSLFVLTLGSCSHLLNDHDLTPIPTNDHIVASEIALSSLNPDIIEYYKDIAVLAEWYADHPAALQAAILFNKTHRVNDDKFNTFVNELSELNLQDEQSKPFSFFDLGEEARHVFLRDYIKMEAAFQDAKHELVGGGEWADDYMELRNDAVDKIVKTSAYSESFNFDAEAAKIVAADPLEEISNEIEEREYTLGNTMSAPEPDQAEAPSSVNTAEQLFYRSLSLLIGASPINFNPLCFTNTPQQFVDRLRAKSQKGLVLVALPGGNKTQLPFALNPHTSLYDLGHVAILSKNTSEIPSQINTDYSLTIGTNSSDKMHQEKIKASWTNQHGMAYLMKPIRKSRKATWKTILGVKVPTGWETIVEDVNNGQTYDKIATVLGKPYCTPPQMLYSMKMVPDAFICSSSAWWAIKQAHGIDISSFYHLTIFPAGIFNSDDMEIVAQTFL